MPSSFFDVCHFTFKTGQVMLCGMAIVFTLPSFLQLHFSQLGCSMAMATQQAVQSTTCMFWRVGRIGVKDVNAELKQ